MRLIVGKAPQVLLLLVLILTYWMYAPGRAEVLLLDDMYSIAGIDLHGSLDQTFFERLESSGSGGPTGRPISTATFIVESVYLKAPVSHRKTVSIILHLVNSMLVFFLFRKLFITAAYFSPGWLALVFSSFWLVSPALVSTTLYLVQRMSVLATLFVLSGCLAYLHWRGQYLLGRGGRVAAALVVAFLACAVFSKENGILLLPIVVALELCWFREASLVDSRVASLHRVLIFVAAASLLVGVLVTMYFLPTLQDGFESRSFSMGERLLTQSRILWDYTFQFINPDIRTMGIYHDDWPISTGFFSPVSTAYAVCGWVFLAGLGFLLWFNNTVPRLSLGIYFYLIAHSLEASILPLELYFEHRNYLPSIGIVILAGTTLGEISKRWSVVVPPLLAWVAVWCIVLASQTGILTQIWSSNRLLAFHHITGHPKSFRANGDIAYLMASVGDQELAFKYSADAHLSTEESDLDFLIRDLTLSCISLKGFPADGWSRVKPNLQPLVLASATGLHQYLRQVSEGKCASEESSRFADLTAMAILNDIDSHKKTSNDVLFLLAELHIELEQYDRASRYLGILLMRDNESQMYQNLNSKISRLRDQAADIG